MVNPPIRYEQETSMDQEIALMKKCLAAQPGDYANWHPIAMDWFNRWKMYVNFDKNFPEPRDPEEIKSLHPGPIDNTSLQNPRYPTELRRGLAEGADLILLPYDLASSFFKKYGGTMNLSRATLNIGSMYMPKVQINLYPIRVEGYCCNALYPQPAKSQYQMAYFNKTQTFSKVLSDMCSKLSIFTSTSTVRYWIRETEEKNSMAPLSKSGNTGNGSGDNQGEEGASKKARVGRLLLARVVNWVEDWKLIGDAKAYSSLTLQEVLGNKDGLEIIIEVTKNAYATTPNWPRAKYLDTWRTTLTRGDVVDVRDKHNKWYEGVVVAAGAAAGGRDGDGKGEDGTGDVHIHFLCWDSTFDEVIPFHQVNTRIQPLHTETSDRSDWGVGDRIDVRLTPPSAPGNWGIGVIREVGADRVKVLYTPKQMSPSSTIHISTSSNAMEIEESDDKKKKSGGGWVGDEVDENDDVPVKSGESKSSIGEKREVEQWFDLYSECICSLYTHNPRPKETSLVTPTYSPISYTSSYTTHKYSYDMHSKGTPPAKGAVGLQNLGNTCFMNSILQCLSHTQILTQFFTSQAYLGQLNLTNPLGHEGKVACAYGKLLQDIYSNIYTKYVPREFKNVLGEFYVQFSGYEQQDAQEFMNFLLDGLHEDLNRLKSKPYVKQIKRRDKKRIGDGSGYDDDEAYEHIIAAESWRRYLLRNDSYIVDHFFGLLKSHLTCPSCLSPSTTYDPYSVLSLPIPPVKKRYVRIAVQILTRTLTVRWVKALVEAGGEGGADEGTMSKLKTYLLNKLEEMGELENMYVGENSSGGDLTSDGYDMINPSSTSTSTPATPSSRHDKYHFHFALTSPLRLTSMQKNYNFHDAGGLGIDAWIGGKGAAGGDSLIIAFQLQYACPDFKPYYYSVSGGLKGSEGLGLEYRAADVCFGQRRSMLTGGYLGGSTGVDVYGVLHRISLPIPNSASVQFTNHDLYAYIGELMVQPLVQSDGRTYSGLFNIAVANTYGTMIFREIEDNDDGWKGLDEGREMLVVLATASLLPYLAPLKNFNLGEGTFPPVPPTRPLSIYDCLDKFTERETLPSTETVYCPECRQHLPPLKKMDVYSLPDVLILHLKRFTFNTLGGGSGGGGGFVYREKINQVVNFPIKGLNLTSYVIGKEQIDGSGATAATKRRSDDEEEEYVHVAKSDSDSEGDMDSAKDHEGEADDRFIYDLYGVSHHMGGLGGGHYTATCKVRGEGGDKWYNFNDSSVSETSAQSCLSGTAYVLFYERRGAKGTGGLRWGGLKPNPNPLPDQDD
eukprot:gene30802-37214_t